MPKLKQPTSLQELVFDFIVNHCANYCHQLSLKGDLEKLRQTITEIKTELFPWLPPILGQPSEFCENFFEIFLLRGYDTLKSSNICRPIAHNRAAAEIMMDVEIPGLICSDLHLEYLDIRDYRRFKILDALKMYDFPVFQALDYFPLENLTELWMINWCTNHELEIVGSRCRKLKILNISYSRNVTDDGLRALRPCADLRVIHFRCSVSKVTNDAINELLSTHTKLEEFNTISVKYLPGRDEIRIYDPCSRRQTLVCPSVKRYCIRGAVWSSDLNAIVTLFPNLTNLQFCCRSLIDLRVLQNLKNLKVLCFLGIHSVIIYIEQLLTVIGENISVIEIKMSSTAVGHLTQNDVNFVHKFCKNIQEFVFSYRPTIRMDKLLMPSFMKLKKLSIERCFMLTATIEFQEMPELEDLTLVNFEPIVDIISSIMLDNIRFGKLKMFHSMILEGKEHQRLNGLNQIAKEMNIDFSVVFFGDFEL
ncbi:uncharacterized protein LOC124295296 [Neodiprion lecontei]|uniref:Uncharacterized protein LOC124295296 n=1 Tax=Neodiprion lecontei TaxID=441921 RepID=A0ABM3GKH3_NEOLC|nr:uncharacterized protein LOC124295296 [Neodiprion lecontei]XP_046600768.1 uncharacterized protein LOC124295296 [Neodiprion lecontei]